MKQKLDVLLRPVVLTIALSSAFVAGARNAPAQNTSSTMTFQREVDSASPGPFGTAVLKKQGTKQIFSVAVHDLAGSSFGVFVGTSNDTNTPIFLISAMDGQPATGDWVLKYSAVGSAPPQLGVTNLDDLAGLFLFIGTPGQQTNVVNGVTNIISGTVLFTQITPLTNNASAVRYNLKSPLTPPAVAPPNPRETGFVKTTYVGSRGRSVLTIFATRLSGGGAYTIFVEDPPSSQTLTNIGNLVLSLETHTGTFRRDTRNGETLPFGSSTVQNLSGRAIEIHDAFGVTHLQGVIP